MGLLLIFLFSANQSSQQEAVIALRPETAVPMAKVAQSPTPSSPLAISSLSPVPLASVAGAGSAGSIDQQITALSSASVAEALAANGSDSDLAASDALLLNAAANSYNENAL